MSNTVSFDGPMLSGLGKFIRLLSLLLRDVVKKCRENGVAVTLASYLESEIHAPQPSIRLAIQTGLTNDQLTKIVKIV